MNIVQFGLVACINFYLGIIFGFRHSADFSSTMTDPPPKPSDRSLMDGTLGVKKKDGCLCNCADLERQVKDMKVEAQRASFELETAKQTLKTYEDIAGKKAVETVKRAVEAGTNTDGGKSSCTSTPEAFKKNSKKFLAGAGGLSRVNKREFLETHDYGWPLPQPDGTEALILHEFRASPTVPGDTGEDGPSGIPYYSKVEDATANCGELLVVQMDKNGNKNKCVALLSGYPSYHVGRFMRKNGRKLEHFARGNTENSKNFRPPGKGAIERNWSALSRYIAAKEVAHSTLDAILNSIAKDNTVIVMVCNIGQAVLLANFVCHGRRHGFPLDNVLVFATDEKTHRLATSLGVTSYFDEKNFGHLPEKEARSYGDNIFTQMMHAKVLTVQMVNYLGYDLLFQDVDVIWWKNPLELFHKKDGPLVGYDMLFQDDGARSQRFAPYSANSGFYYVRHNPRTVYLFTSLMYHTDMINGSHQDVLIQLMTEHASLFGLKVKVLDDEDFPTGFHYHRRKDLMKSIMKGETVPYVYHSSWTANKVDKLKYLKQMGLWHVEEKCEDEKGLTLIDELKGHSDKDVVFNACCSVEPLFECFYRDKPSKLPCKDSPPIDKGRPSFW